ncbi:MAG: TrkA family potassium uptake protein [Acidilobaceae archaeon]
MLIVGANLIARYLAERLAEEGHSVTVVDSDRAELDKIRESIDVETYAGDVLDPEFYDSIDVLSYDVVVVVTQRDEVSLYASAIAKTKGIRRVYMVLGRQEVAEAARLMGITSVLVWPQLVASTLQAMIEGSQRVLSIVPALSGGYALVSSAVTKTSPYRGRHLRELKAEASRFAKVLAVLKKSNLIEPEDSVVLEEGDSVIALVKKEAIEEYSKLF